MLYVFKNLVHIKELTVITQTFNEIYGEILNQTKVTIVRKANTDLIKLRQITSVVTKSITYKLYNMLIILFSENYFDNKYQFFSIILLLLSHYSDLQI